MAALGAPRVAYGAPGQDDPVALGAQAVELYRAGRYEEAIKLERRVVDLAQQRLGADHADTAAAWFVLAMFLDNAKQYEESERNFRRAIQINERALGPQHPTVADNRERLGLSLAARGQTRAAEAELRKAVAIREKANGKLHPAVATTLNRLGRVLEDAGDYAQAEVIQRKALAVREAALPPNDPDLNLTRANLATLLARRGALDEGEKLGRQALAGDERGAGPSSAVVATDLTNLASTLFRRGDYAEAERLLRRAVAIWESKGPGHDADVAHTLHNLGAVLLAFGAVPEAETAYRKAVSLRESALGKEHAHALDSLQGLAGVLRRKNDSRQAEQIYRDILGVREKRLGPNHPDVGRTLSHLAAVLEQGSREATSLLRRALAIKERALGKDHPEVADVLNDLAVAEAAGGRPAEATPLLERAREILEGDVGQHTVLLAQVFENLSWTLALAGSWQDSLAALERSLDLDDQLMDLALSSGGEQRRLEVIRFYSAAVGSALSVLRLLTVRAPTAPALSRVAMRALMGLKGRALEASADVLGALRRSSSREDATLLEQLRATQDELAAKTWGGSAPRESPDEAAALRGLQEKQRQLEAAVAERFGKVRNLTRRATIEAVQAKLPADAALLEYGVTEPFGAGEREYVVGVLRANGDPRLVVLGPATGIDELVARLRHQLAHADPDYARTARELGRRALDPALEGLEGIHDLYVAPDGMLSLAPVAALILEGEEFVIGSHRVTYLNAGRDLLREGASVVRQPPLVVANPEYSSKDARGAGAERSGAPGFELSKIHFEPLPGTEQEGRAVSALLDKSVTATGKAATETLLRGVHGPAVLHVATHGFFLGARDPAREQTRGLVLTADDGVLPSPPPDSPLLRSGLALAGANTRGQGVDDGILTALELAALDLEGTRLAVLSACETGIGEVYDAAGVYGMQRALVIAGSETQVISLWKVDDDATVILMRGYYERLRQGLGRSDALREAQLALLARPETAHPYFWAAFYAAGDPRALDGKPPAKVRSARAVPVTTRGRPTGPRVTPNRGCGCSIPTSGEWPRELSWIAAASLVALRSVRRSPSIRQRRGKGT